MNIDSRLRNWIVIITSVILIFTIGFTVGGRSKITFVENVLGKIIQPVQKGFNTVGDYFSEKTDPIFNIWTVYKRNKELVKENELLKTELVSTTLTNQEYLELKELRKALNYAEQNDINYYITSNVTAKDVGNWYSMFVIDSGIEDGVTKNSTVFNGSGLIGLVYEVGDDWAKVVSIIDNKSSVSFEILDTTRNFDGKISGSIEAELNGELFDPQASVYVGDKLITSGLGIYPRGILIGEVKEVVEDKNSLLKQIIVEPSVDFKKLRRVFVVPKLSTFEE